MTTDHLHAEHDERYDPDCSCCQQAFEEEAAEHAWMGLAVKRMDFNPYAPLPPQSPDRSWYIDAEGYVKVDA